MKTRSNVLGVLFVCAASCGGERALHVEGTEILIGVIPFGFGKANAPCQANPYALSVSFEMDDEDDTRCSYESGDWGEGTWVPPDAIKRGVEHPCSASNRHSTLLHFCRVAVEADTFRPLTSDPHRIEDSYAVLLLGERCPAGATQILKRIYNEDHENKNAFHGAAGTQGPNESTTGVRGAQTTLNFCYFRGAAADVPTMSEFPDLGFPYGVFHDFDVPQPGWVLSKRWQLSDDSNNSSVDRNYYRPAHAEETQDFMRIVENPTRDDRQDTCFDMAQVR